MSDNRYVSRLRQIVAHVCRDMKVIESFINEARICSVFANSSRAVLLQAGIANVDLLAQGDGAGR